MSIRACLLPLIALASPAAALDVLPLPEGCTAYLTMQDNACSVSHYFTCTSDAPGTQRRVDLDQDGVTYVGQIDAETQWLVSNYRRSGHTETLEDSPRDPASFTELLEEGISTFDFQTNSDEIGPMRYVGADMLTGESTTIDGVELLRTEFVIRVEDGDGQTVYSSTGSEYISPEWRTFFGGTSSVVTDTGTVDYDASPVEFFTPDEDGFLSTRPKYGCGATESAFEVTQ